MMSVYDEIEKYLETNNFKTQKAFVDSVSRIASTIWDERDIGHPSNVYKNTDTKKLPETAEEIRNKIAEIKARNAGNWEPYMIMKEICGVDLIKSPDIKDIFPDEEKKEEYIKQMNSKKADPINNNGIFRRAQPQQYSSKHELSQEEIEKIGKGIFEK